MKEYEEFLTAYEELKKQVESYYIYNDYGEQPKLYEEDMKELKEKYQEVFKLASIYLEKVPKEDEVKEKANMEKADMIQSYLQRDMNAFNEFVPGTTLPSCLKYVNSKVVNVTGKTFETTGANCNIRTKMTITGSDGKPITGFFTERRYVGLNPKNAPYYVEKLSREKPQFAEIYEYAIPKIFSQEKGYVFSTYNGENEELKQLKNRFGSRKGFDEALEDLDTLHRRMRKNTTEVSMYLNENNPVSPFDTRNIAMTNVANLLGMGDKIAKSTPLRIKNKENELSGTFMEFAKGEDPTAPKENGNLIKANKNCFDNSPVLKTISDMQVLDYICGNSDRHMNNLFFTCDENGKVIDIMGIDNDMSFGHMGKDMQSFNSGGLLGIFEISKSMYDKVMNLDKHLLVHALDGLGFEKKNIDLTLERFDALKEKIEKGDVVVIEDKDYEKFKMEDFILKDFQEVKSFTYKDKTIEKIPFFSIYKNIKNLGHIMERKKEKIEEYYKAHPEKRNEQAKPKKLRDSDIELNFEEKKEIKVEELEMGVDAPQITELSSKLEKAERFITNSSKQFEDVKTNLSKLNEATNLISKDEKLLTATNVNAINKAYKDLLKNCNDYIEHKREQGKLDAWSWTPTGRRIKAIKEVATFCKGRINTLQKAIDNTMEKEVVEKAEVRNMKNEAEELLFSQRSPKEIGNYMKELVKMRSENPDNKAIISKLGQQMDMCMNYIKKKGGENDSYGLTKEDVVNSRNLLKEARDINRETKKEQLKDIKDKETKSALM